MLPVTLRNEGFMSQNPQEGLREMSGAELAMVKRGAELHREIKLKQLYPQMIVKAKEKVDKRETCHTPPVM